MATVVVVVIMEFFCTSFFNGLRPGRYFLTPAVSPTTVELDLPPLRFTESTVVGFQPLPLPAPAPAPRIELSFTLGSFEISREFDRRLARGGQRWQSARRWSTHA